MDDLTLTSLLALLGNQLIFPVGLIVGLFAIVARCVWPKGRQMITPIAGILLISSIILLRTEFVMFLVVQETLAWIVILAEFAAVAFVALALIFGLTRWPKATKLFFRPLSIFLAILIGFQFFMRLVGVFII